jgi:hypothetical protein
MPKTARKPSVSKNSGAPLDGVSGAVVRLLSSMNVNMDYVEQEILWEKLGGFLPQLISGTCATMIRCTGQYDDGDVQP